MPQLNHLSRSLRSYSSRLTPKHKANFVSIKKLIPDYQNLETKCNCYYERLQLPDPIAPITNITTKVSETPPLSMIPVYKRHVLLIDETSPSKQAHMNWKSKVEDVDASVYPYGILKTIKERNTELLKQRESMPILVNVMELVNFTAGSKKKYKILCLPEWKVLAFDEAEIDHVSDLVNRPMLEDIHNIEVLDFPEESLLLICGHNQRDARCGVMSKELIDNTKFKNPIGLVSHIGGHKFAGNVIMYNKLNDETNTYWFRHMNPLVADVVLDEASKGNMVSEFYRGSTKFKK